MKQRASHTSSRGCALHIQRVQRARRLGSSSHKYRASCNLTLNRECEPVDIPCTESGHAHVHFRTLERARHVRVCVEQLIHDEPFIGRRICLWQNPIIAVKSLHLMLYQVPPELFPIYWSPPQKHFSDILYTTYRINPLIVLRTLKMLVQKFPLDRTIPLWYY